MSRPAFRVRQARVGDLPSLWPLARRLNSYNLPADRRLLAQLVATSVRSFLGLVPRPRARYLFVMERWRDRRVVGCSLMIAKHGTPRVPHLRLDRVTIRGRRALRFGVTTDGPTEVGGLVLLPAFRKHPAHLGRQLSYARLAYLASYPERFEPEVLVEYLPPLTSSGDSRLWHVLGGPLTGLSYREADRRSATDKTFILRAFPRTPIWLDTLPPAVRRDLGRLHPAAAGACRLLRGIGFRDLRQLEPFDGGPYYGAQITHISIIRKVTMGVISPGSYQNMTRYGLIWTEPRRGDFRAVESAYRDTSPMLSVSNAALQRLDVRPGDVMYATPLAR